MNGPRPNQSAHFAWPSDPIERTITLVRQHRDIVSHLGEVHFNQRPKIIRTDGGHFCSLALYIAQHPAEMNCSLYTQPGQWRVRSVRRCCFISPFTFGPMCGGGKFWLCPAANRTRILLIN